MTRWNRVAAMLGLWGLAGCGGADPNGRLPVTGTVTLDGKPLPDGSLTLVPTGDGPAVGATIDRGSFTIARGEGPPPGAYRVEILSIRATGRTIPDPEGPRGPTVAERKNVIPDRYGSRSDLKAEIKPGVSNDFRFELASEPDKPAAGRRRR